jgi:beta-mannosidase
LTTTVPSGPARGRARSLAVDGWQRRPLADGWLVTSTPPGAVEAPDGLPPPGEAWHPAQAPGTAASALRAAGAWRSGDPRDFDADDWWFSTRFDAAPDDRGSETVLHVEGLATSSTLWLNGELVASGESMFAPATVPVGDRLAGSNELVIRCAALAPRLASGGRPRARWHTRVVAAPGLRRVRTSILGRAPGFAPGPAPVGPWRPLVLERRRLAAVDALVVACSLEGDEGVLRLTGSLRPLGGDDVAGTVVLEGPTGTHRGELSVRSDGRLEAQVGIAGVHRWWPHTHGRPARYALALELTAGGRPLRIDAGHVGFRTISSTAADPAAPFRIAVNGVEVFCRGASWLPPDAVRLTAPDEVVAARLDQVVDCGMNMLRLPGVGVYEDDRFHDGCDARGILVWQDLMLANLDYPFADEPFRAAVEAEAVELLERHGGRPSLTVVCGGSEIEQQQAMLGLEPTVGAEAMLGGRLRELVAEHRPDVPYLPSTPTGGELPFRARPGVAHYFGVGAYRRPLTDARLAEVGFASECLAFANVPEPPTLEAVLPSDPTALAVHHPAWKAGVPRDRGAGWDFDDVRDHYLGACFGVDPLGLRAADHERYLALSRAVTGEVVAAVLGEWRRRRSPTRGALVWILNDLVPGAGWGLVDAFGVPKAVWWHARRALAPVAVWLTPEGGDGIAIHVANDGPEPLATTLAVRLYRRGELLVEEAEQPLELAAHETVERSVEGLLGRFVDAAYAYRFGPPGHDLVVAELAGAAGPGRLATCFPLGPPIDRPERPGVVEARGEAEAAGGVAIWLESARVAYGVRIDAPGFVPDDNHLVLVPGIPRRVRLRPEVDGAVFAGAAVESLDATGRTTVPASAVAGAGAGDPLA